MEPESAADSRPPVSRTALFLGFLKIGMLGFGGVAPWARRIIVEENRWLSEREYAEVLGVGQVLPGPNTINAAVMIGDRFQGAVGAVIAVVAIMVMPLVILMALTAVYEHFAAHPAVSAAIGGMAAAAAGLIIGTALKMARRLKPDAIGVVFGLAACGALVWLHLSLIAVVLVLAPLSVGASLMAQRRS